MKGPRDLKGAVQQVGTALGAVNETPLGFGGLWSDLSSHRGRREAREGSRKMRALIILRFWLKVARPLGWKWRRAPGLGTPMSSERVLQRQRCYDQRAGLEPGGA